MKRTKLAVGLLGVLALGLAGCRGTGGNGSGNKKIVFWECLGHNKATVLENLVNSFNEAHKDTDGYTVELEHIAGEYTALHDTVKTKLQAGSVPSITMGYPDSFAEYIGFNGKNRSRILDLTDYIKNDKDFQKEDMVEQYFNEGNQYQYEGIWSVPMYKSTEIMYYNKTLFEASNFYKSLNDQNAMYTSYEGANYQTDLRNPSTWDWETLVYVGTQIQEENKSKSDFAAIGYDSDANFFITQMAQRGIPYTTKEGDKTEHILFMDENTGKPNEKLTQLVQETYNLTKNKVLITQGSYGNYASSLFQQQKVMFTIGSTGGSAYNESTGKYQVALAPVPCYHRVKKYIQQGPSVCFFNLKDEGLQKAAWEFYSRYLSDPKENADLALANSYDPVRISSYKTEDYINWLARGKDKDGKEDLSKPLLYRIPSYTSQLTKDYITSPVFIGSQACRTEIGKVLSYANSNNGKIEDAIETAYKNMSTALQ